MKKRPPLKTRNPYGSWEELHDSLQYGRKSITNRSYLQCTLCSEGNVDELPFKSHSISLRPSGVLVINSVGFYVCTPRANNQIAIANVWVVNLILDNIGYRWAPIGTGPHREYMGLAKKTLPYPSTKFDRAAISDNKFTVEINWNGSLRIFDGRNGWVNAPDDTGKRYPKKSEANKLANYHARILGFPSTSKLWGYKMPKGLTTEGAKELAQKARNLGYAKVSDAWENGCFITWDPVFGDKIPMLGHQYNMSLQKADDPWQVNPMIKRKPNEYYERTIKKRTI